MSKEFLTALEGATNFTLTENLGLARKTTNSELLNFYSLGGALRPRSEEDIQNLFNLAFIENPEYALKAAFYFRDVRGGQGERRTFRAILKSLASYPETAEWLSENVRLIPFYGRWDDLFVLFRTSVERSAMSLIKKQLAEDEKSDNPSILAKWLPSENTSSLDTRINARLVREYLGLSPRQYRKTLSRLRKKIDIVERKISANEWGEVNYERVPSQANVLYRKAFNRHDAERYSAFWSAVKEGKAKVNTSVLYPYEILRTLFNADFYYDVPSTSMSAAERVALDTLWNNLPNYAETPEDSLVVTDVSGSMFGLPICVAISLAIYLAERNNGVFLNKFITFSQRPELQTIKGKDLYDKVKNLSKAQWDMNTNIEAVFDLVLNTAVRAKVSNDKMVKKIYVVSDMEFDSCASTDKTVFQHIAEKYKEAGYDMPFLVFWNVSSRNNQFPMSLDDRGFLNVSGCSPSIYTSLVKSEFKDAYQFMIDQLSSDRYKDVKW